MASENVQQNYSMSFHKMFIIQIFSSTEDHTEMIFALRADGELSEQHLIYVLITCLPQYKYPSEFRESFCTPLI